MDIPKAARCVPGVESVEPLGGERYRGRLRVQLGPIRLSFEGDISIEARDDAARTATMRAEGADKAAGGGVRALVAMSLSGSGAPPGELTDVALATDLQLAGRIGELGQPLIKRKADQMLDAFATNLQRELA
jgi:carbon monoxide dehydrogenase subunit G